MGGILLMNINTNISSITTQHYMRKNNVELASAMERLSSGKRINSAADDAAGLAITSRMTAITRGLDAAIRNANDGNSLLQTAESSLGSISSLLQRIRELAVQADNDTYSANDKQSLQDEINQMLSEIDHVAATTEFNGVKLLDGTVPTINLHISHLATDTIQVTLQDATTGATGLNLDPTTNVDVTGAGTAQTAIATIDAALDTITSQRAGLGAMMNRMNYTIDNLSATNTNMQASRSRIEDADMAAEVSRMSKQKVLLQSSISMLTQANQQPQMILSLLQNQ
jgi:flagellin